MSVTELAEGKLRLDRPAPHVARLTIDNPAKRNALDQDILGAIASTVRGLDDARCLLLTAEGRVFSAGYDVSRLARDEPAVPDPFQDAIDAVDAFPYPAVAALNGHTIGGGLELALSCDLRLAAESAKLAMPPAKLGLVYSHTGLRTFIDAIGVARTRHLFFTARSVSAATALTWGMVNDVVPDAELGEQALAYAAAIAANAPLSLAGTKRVIRALTAAAGRLEPGVERELRALREASFHTDDFSEGVRAFAEKRAPRWQGS